MAQFTSNGKPFTLLPFEAYNQYEQEYKETFAETVNLKQYLDSVIYSSTMNDDTETTDISTDDASDDTEITSNNGPSTSPLPATFNDTPTNPNMRIQLMMEQLQHEANTREDIEEFVKYIKQFYNIDLNEPHSDLPFEVIDEILTYLDYDPDKQEIDFETMLTHEGTDTADQIIIPIYQIKDFQNALNKFRLNIKTLKHLDSMNCITNDRCDRSYYKFQNILRPMIASLIKLYKINLNDFIVILRDSMNYHEQQRQL